MPCDANTWRVWRSFCACAACELMAGQVYIFGLWSDVLRRSGGLALGQASVESVAISENLGQYVRLAGGLAFDTWGAQATLRVGFVLNGVGFLAVFAATHLAESADAGHWRMPLPALCAFAATFGQGAGWVETAVVSTAVESFSDEAPGLLKTFFGIAAAFGSMAFAAILAPRRDLLLLGLGLAPLLIGLPLSGLVRPPAPPAGSKTWAPWGAAYALCFLAVMVLTLHSALASMTPLLRPYEDHRLANLLAFGVVCALFAAIPLLPLCQATPGGSSDTPLARHATVNAQDDCTFLQAMCKPTFWCLFCALGAGYGAGLLVLNNMGQLVKALDRGSPELQPVCVTIFAVFNATGRLAMGQAAASETMGGRRTLLLAGTLAATAVAYVGSSLAEGPKALGAALPFLGLGYGSLWTLQPLLASELFGKISFGAKYAMLSMAAVAGSLPLCRFVVPYFYDQHAGEDGWCVGAECFRGSLLTAAGFCGVGAALSLALDCSRNGAWAYATMWTQEQADAEEHREATIAGRSSPGA